MSPQFNDLFDTSTILLTISVVADYAIPFYYNPFFPSNFRYSPTKQTHKTNKKTAKTDFHFDSLDESLNHKQPLDDNRTRCCACNCAQLHPTPEKEFSNE
mmetsp:Transcript_10529/g.30809  ORF Transcript_10529/g.30809 Transcript_10529/m.30809 type:complete len:100 (+) Transcript_10529:699-998(+)